ncbi:MAG: hypothetical protein N3A01_01965 [Bacteroidales bacterium]|nr:hypothetical protein [Bacteroidales bacterium]
MIDFILYLTYFLIAAAIFLALFFAVKSIIQNFKASRISLIGILVLIIVFVVSYIISSSETYEKFQIGASLSKAIGGALYTLYFIFILTIVAALYSELNKFFK